PDKPTAQERALYEQREALLRKHTALQLVTMGLTATAGQLVTKAVAGKTTGSSTPKTNGATVAEEQPPRGAGTGQPAVPKPVDKTADGPYSSQGMTYGEVRTTDAAGNPVPTQPTLPKGGSGAQTADKDVAAAPGAAKAGDAPVSSTSQGVPAAKIGSESNGGMAGRSLVYEAPSTVVQSRVDDLLKQIPANSQGRITMGVAVLEDANGVRSVVVSTSEPRGYLRPGVTLQPGEVVIAGTGHAEADIVSFANANGLKVIDIGATRPVCAGCQKIIEPTGANIATPLKSTPKPTSENP
ncbi:MAG: hypothetical protein ACOVOD_16460, partial [Rhodoferax sp.]